MCAHVLSVKTLRMNGLLSPEECHRVDQLSSYKRCADGDVDAPCRVTILAIWMTGSLSASGKIPFRPAHSISKLRILRGARLLHSPSGACEMRSSDLARRKRRDTGVRRVLILLMKRSGRTGSPSRSGTATSSSRPFGRCTCPAGPRASSYRQSVECQTSENQFSVRAVVHRSGAKKLTALSIMNRSSYAMLLSYVATGPSIMSPKLNSPLSSSPLTFETNLGSERVILRKGVWSSPWYPQRDRLSWTLV